jgi:hypothetical protein
LPGSLSRTSSGFRAVFGKSSPVKVTPIRLRVLSALGVSSVKGFRLNLAPSTTVAAPEATGDATAAAGPAAAAADASLLVLSDVAEEQLRVAEVDDYAAYPLVIKGLHKVYPAQDRQQPKVRGAGGEGPVCITAACRTQQGGGACHFLRKTVSAGEVRVHKTAARGTICDMLQVAVRRLDLAVAQGECFGLLGPNGAGKSSSISMLVGLQEPTAGTAIIGECSVLGHARVCGWQLLSPCKPASSQYSRQVNVSPTAVCEC